MEKRSENECSGKAMLEKKAMSRFQYIAKSYSNGSEYRGTIEAADRNSAIAAIRANGLMLYSIGTSSS